MDSVTQVALGSAIGIAVMGRRSAVWKSALWGGVCGTLPDLDVLIDHGDAIRNMTFHRAESHSLFYLTLLSVPLAWLIARVDRLGIGRWWVATWLALITHPLLDWLTIYGTQLALPFTDFPFAVGSVFVVDPIYTLLLIGGIAAALVAARRSTGNGLRWNLLGLTLATAYLAAGVALQAHVTGIARASLLEPAAQSGRLLVVPTPFNTILWRVVAMEGDSYLEGYYSLLDREPRIAFDRYPAGTRLRQEAGDNWYIDRIAWFSHGFFRLRREQGALLISDLRMGQEPSYTFTFTIPEGPGNCQPAAPPAEAGCNAPSPPAAAGEPAKPVLLAQRVDWRPALAWLWRRILGEPLRFPGA